MIENLYSSVAWNSLKHYENESEKDALRLFPEIPGDKGEQCLYHVLPVLEEWKIVHRSENSIAELQD